MGIGAPIEGPPGKAILTPELPAARAARAGSRLRGVGPEIEVMSGARDWRRSLEADRMTVGKSAENDLPLPDDPTASHLHAVLERFPAGWCVADLGSSNGTWLNGSRIWSSQRLRHGDEIRVGQTRLIFRDFGEGGGAETEAEEAPPALTVRERDVLVALCRPLLARDMFTEPASTRAIADELVITQAAVKQHLANLFDKFGVPAGESNRRVRLANDALRRGAVSIGDLRGVESPEAG
jgi:pSer/pThr/pTyr-binding forkhead associated (FHA) protein